MSIASYIQELAQDQERVVYSIPDVFWLDGSSRTTPMRDAARFPIIISASDKGNSHSCRGLNCRRDDTQTSVRGWLAYMLEELKICCVLVRPVEGEWYLEKQ